MSCRTAYTHCAARDGPMSVGPGRTLVVEARPLDRRGRHLREMHEGGLVVHREGRGALVEQLDRAELAPVEGRQRSPEPPLERALPVGRAKERRTGELVAADPRGPAARAEEAVHGRQV